MERTLIAPGVHLSCDPAEKFNRCRIISNNLLEKETLNEIFRQFKRVLKHQIIYYLQNPGSDFCDTKILQLKAYPR